MNANKQDAGGLPELPETIWLDSLAGRLYTADQMRAYGELCRAAPAGGDVAVGEIGELNGTKLIVGRDEDALARLPKGTKLYTRPQDSAPAGSGEELAKWVEGARDYATGGNVRPDDGDEDQEQWDRLTEAATLLRKLQQGAGHG